MPHNSFLSAHSSSTIKNLNFQNFWIWKLVEHNITIIPIPFYTSWWRIDEWIYRIPPGLSEFTIFMSLSPSRIQNMAYFWQFSGQKITEKILALYTEKLLETKFHGSSILQLKWIEYLLWFFQNCDFNVFVCSNYDAKNHNSSHIETILSHAVFKIFQSLMTSFR